MDDGGDSPHANVDGAISDEGGFSIVREANDTLRFVTADGRTIPRHRYRPEDFVDDDASDGANANADADADVCGTSREGFCTTTVQRDSERMEVREPAGVYRLRRSASG